ncbi:MAG: hypothetical protein PWQ73_739, partial [Petrotoga sp.]|nr:hypothetical protein [Petrotoga sp.]
MNFKSIRGRITLIIVIIFVLFGAAISFNIFSLIRSNDGLGSYRDLSDATNQISEIENNFFETALAFKDYVINYDEQTREIITQNIDTVQSFFTGETTNSTVVQNVITKIGEYESNFNQIVQLNEEKERIATDEFNNISSQVINSVSEFKSYAQKSITSSLLLLSDNIQQILDETISFTHNYLQSKSNTDKVIVISNFEEIESLFNRVNYEISYGIVTDELINSFET